jgi:hypothetical protein
VGGSPPRAWGKLLHSTKKPATVKTYAVSLVDEFPSFGAFLAFFFSFLNLATNASPSKSSSIWSHKPCCRYT